ncbi:MAG: hypothetical protein ACC726_16025 [Chloroflexota bacterium]
MSTDTRSDQACPVCGNHTLAVDEPPRIDVMGVQAYSDIVGMGDVSPTARLGIVCLTCDTRWVDKEAFDRGEPEPEMDVAGEAADTPDVENEGETSEA